MYGNRRDPEQEHGLLIEWPPRVRRDVRMGAGIPGAAFRFSKWIRKEGVDVRGIETNLMDEHNVLCSQHAFRVSLALVSWNR